MIEFLFFFAAGLGVASLCGTLALFCWAVFACARDRKHRREFERELAEAERRLAADIEAFEFSTFEWPVTERRSA